MALRPMFEVACSYLLVKFQVSFTFFKAELMVPIAKPRGIHPSAQTRDDRPRPRQNLSKRSASPAPAVQRKVAKKPSTIASRGRGGSVITARSRQVEEVHNSSESDVPRDVLSEHQRRNGVPRAPDPGHLALQASGRSGPVTDTSTRNSIGTKARSANNGDPKTLKYYSPVWKTILNRARFLSRLDAVISNAFPERQVFLSSKANEFITQAVAELQEDGVPPDEVFLRDHRHHMGDLVCLLWLPDILLMSTLNLAFRRSRDFSFRLQKDHAANRCETLGLGAGQPR